MTAATVIPISSPYTVLPVQHGLAEQLARVAHFRTLDLPEVDELDQVAGFLIGDVGTATDRQMLWATLREDAEALWHLISEDWSERDLDEVPEQDWRRYDFATLQQETDHRYTVTRDRLVDLIESAVRRGRYAAVAARRSERHRQHAIEESIARHPAGSKLRGGEPA